MNIIPITSCCQIGTLLYDFAGDYDYALRAGGIAGSYLLFNFSGCTSNDSLLGYDCVLAYDVSKHEVKRVVVMDANVTAWNGLLIWRSSADTIAYYDMIDKNGGRIRSATLVSGEAFDERGDKAAISDTAFVHTDSSYDPQILYLVPLK